MGTRTNRRFRTHVVIHLEGERPPRNLIERSDKVLRVTLDSDAAGAVNHNAWVRLAESRFVPDDAAIDFFRIASGVFFADLRVSRTTAFDRWTRDLALSVPVLSMARWKQALDPLTRLLSFLTGDHWELQLYATDERAPSLKVKPKERKPAFVPTVVSLLSGGLDSFIGASDLLARGEKPVFVSHYAQGSAAASSPAQKAVSKALATRYDAKNFLHAPIHLTPRKSDTDDLAEETTRSRSIIFLALGVLFASAMKPPARRLFVPENGFISLNVPLASTRMGSLSTKTTHPHTLALLREVLHAVKLDVEIVAPYRLRTKGEMVAQAVDREFVLENAKDTVSCARPTQSRWTKGGSAHHHCGYCFPCIVRRSSLPKDDPTGYIKDARALNSGTEAQLADVSAVRLAAERARHHSSAAEVIATGPLHVSSSADLDGLVGVHHRGLDEITRFLGLV